MKLRLIEKISSFWVLAISYKSIYTYNYKYSILVQCENNWISHNYKGLSANGRTVSCTNIVFNYIYMMILFRFKKKWRKINVSHIFLGK